MGNRFVVLAATVLLFGGCAQGHCRRKAEPPPPAQPVSSPAADTGSMSKSSEDHIFVYKYDGSLQCKAGKGESVESMAKELKGLRIFSSEKKSDGLMHIQVCGSITGKANVYEIESKNLKAAQRLGFKKWNFNE